MINIQKYGSKKVKTKPNYNPARFRITQLASTSVDKFIQQNAKGTQDVQTNLKRHLSCEKKVSTQSLSKTIHLFFNQNTTVQKKKSGQVLKIFEGSTDKIYNNKKKNYSNYVKQIRVKMRTAPISQFINIESRPVSHINFNQTLFHRDTNLITRKRKSKKHKEVSLHSKTETEGFSEVVVFRPKQLSKVQKNAFKSFIELSTHKKSDDEIVRHQEKLLSYKKKGSQENIKHEPQQKVKISQKKPYLIRIHSQQSQLQKGDNELFVPFKRLKEKRKPFTFALFQKQSKINVQNSMNLLNYKDFLWKINYSNGLYVRPSELGDPIFKVYVGWGNNDSLIRNVFKRRFWWTFSQNLEECNFVWSQLKIQSVFQKQANSQKNEGVSKVSVDENIGDLEQMKIRSKGHYKIFNCYDMANWIIHEQNNKSSEMLVNQKTYKNRLQFIRCKKLKTIENSQHLRVHNHFIHNGYIGNKKALFHNLKRYYELQKKDVFDVIPFTVHVSKGVEDEQWTFFKKIYQKYENEKRSNNSQNIWIMKPGENSNRGIGITVFHDLEDIRLRLKSKEKNKDGTLRTFIIQKYIEKPLLYNNRKFDIRHYLLMSCINGKFKAYWYEEGYIRTSSCTFTLKRGSNVFAHLTNDAIQKNSQEYGKFQPGNKVSYQKFDKYLRDVTKGKQHYFRDHILPKMKQIASEAVRATFLNLDGDRKQHNFQLFGMDFMIDSELKPWLIQINTNPCLEISCPLLARIIPKVVEQTLQLCLDPLFPSPNEWPNNKTLWISQKPLQTTNFQLIFDQETEGQELQSLMSGSMQKTKAKIGQVDDQDQLFGSEQTKN